MKLKFVLPYFFVLTSVSITCSGQDFLFKALTQKGQIEISKFGSDSTRPILIGTELFEGDIITLNGDTSYVALIHSSGGTIELTEAGTYNVGNLSRSIPPAEKNVSALFLRFVTNKMNSVKPDLHYNYRENLKVVAGVQRATNGFIKLV